MTPKERAAMQQALEALELARGSHGVMLMSNPPHDAWQYRGCDYKLAEAITALREALDHFRDATKKVVEQAEQEPDDLDWITPEAVFEAKLKLHGIPNPPVQQVDLTDDEIMKINVDTAGIVPTCDRQFHFARAVIAADREKNK